MAQGYDGLPAYYVESSDPLTPNLGLSLKGMDPVLAENMVLIDTAVGSGGGSSVAVNSVIVNNPNFNNSTPAAPAGKTNITWQVSGSNVSAYYTPLALETNGVANGDQTLLNLVGSGAIDVLDDGSGDVTFSLSVALPQTIAAATSQWLRSYAASTGLFTASQPAFTDISGTASVAQIPNLPASKITSGQLALARGGTGVDLSASGGATQFLAQDASHVISARVISTSDLPAGTGTVTSFSAGNLSPLFTTNVATPTTTPALTFALTNAAGGTLFGNNTTASAAPAYTISPVLGIPGTSTGTLALASSTASGKYTITAPANSATPTLTLPTASNVLAGQLAGDGTIFSASVVGASAAGTLTLPTPSNQSANTVFAGPASGGAAAPTFRALVNADVATLVKWSDLQNASAALSLSNAGNATTFNQTSAVTWSWLNTTAATNVVSQSSPLAKLGGRYWTGAADAEDSWTIQNVVANGTNGNSTLTFVHAGSSGSAQLSIPVTSLTVPNIFTPTSGASIGISVGGNATTPLAIIGPTAAGSQIFTQWLQGTIAFMSLTGAATPKLMSFDMAGTTYTTLCLGAPTAGQNNTTLTAAPGIIFGQSDRAANGYNPTSGTAIGVSAGSNELVSGNGFRQLNFIPSSGTANWIPFRVLSTVNQTSTSSGNYTGLLVNIVETSLKGSANLLLDLQAGSTGGTSQFAINNSGVATKYAATTLVSQGIPSEIVTVDLTAQSAAIAATTLISAPATGMYRISWSATITTAGTTSVLGGTNGFQIVYTSPTDSVAKTTVSGLSVTSAANTTATAVGGSITVYAKTGTNIQYSYDYTSTGTAMVYELHIKLERM